MFKSRENKIVARIFTFAFTVSILSSGVLVHGYNSAETKSVKITYVDKELVENSDDYTIPFSDVSDSKELKLNSKQDTYNFSIEDAIIAGGDSQEGGNSNNDALELSIDSYRIINSKEIPSDTNITADALNLVALPDLVIYSIASSGTYPFAALSASQIKIAVVNTGSATAAASSCGIFIDNQFAGTFSIPSLQSGYGYEAVLTLSNISAGNHTIQARADYSNSVSESNESNNTSSATFSWTGTPDLIVSRFVAATSTPDVGENVNFQFTVSNIGNANATGTFYIEVTINDISVGSIAVSDVLAKGYASGSFTLTFPQKGSYGIQLKVDSRGNIVESNENNNVSLLTVQPKIAEQVTISGTLRYESYVNYGGMPTQQNLNNYQVMIYDKNPIGSTLKATVTTDSSGNFSTVINNETNVLENGSDLYLAIPMNNSYLSISGQTSDDIYQFETPALENYQSATLDMGTMMLDSSELIKGALNIYHWIKTAKDYYESTASPLGKLNIKWEPNGNTGSYFSGSSIYLHGAEVDHYDSTIITHEYGHYIMNYKGASPSNAGGAHYFESPCINTATAYSEAYATFISTQVRNSVTYEDWSTSNTFFWNKS